MNSNNLTSAKILIVDDSDFSRSLVNGMLAEAGFKVIGEASDAETALPLIKEKSPDIVIADIVMPDMSGLELTENIVQNHSSVNVILISSLSQEHIVLDAINAGASDFIAKPIQKQQLIDSVEKIMTERLRG